MLEYFERWEFIDRVEVVSYKQGTFELEIFTPSSSEQFVRLVTAGAELDPASLVLTEEGIEVQHFMWLGED